MALASLADLKVELGIPPTTTANDQLLQMLLDSSEGQVLQWVSRSSFEVRTYTEIKDGNNKTKLLLRNWPVQSVTSVTINGDNIPVVTAFNEQGVRLHEGALLLQGGRVFTKGDANITVVYSAGYATIPREVSFAVILAAAHRYKETAFIGLQSKSMAGESISYATLSADSGRSIANGGLPPAALSILNNYKRVTYP
jgi:hypothetical protein